MGKIPYSSSHVDIDIDGKRAISQQSGQKALVTGAGRVRRDCRLILGVALTECISKCQPC